MGLDGGGEKGCMINFYIFYFTAIKILFTFFSALMQKRNKRNQGFILSFTPYGRNFLCTTAIAGR